MNVEETDMDESATDPLDDAAPAVAVGPGRPRPALAAEPVAERLERRDALDVPPPLTSAEYSVAFSPRNLAIGLGIVAAVVALLVSRRRPRTSGRDEG